MSPRTNHMATVIGVVIAVLSVLVNIAVAWSKIPTHMDNTAIHLDKDAVIKGGGPAYKNDLTQEHARTRKLLKSMTFSCKMEQPNAFTCKVDLPETGD